MFLGVTIGKLPITDYQLPVAIMMGGLVVGIGYRLEDWVRQSRSLLLWKTSFMTTGFALVLSALLREWATASALLLLELGIVWWFVFAGVREPMSKQEKGERVLEIEGRMKKCC